eukprot:7540641-Heterocapsa_arctica.AAC.1
MAHLAAAIEAASLDLRRDKSQAHCPAATAAEVTQIAAELADFATYDADGLTVLGAAADGQYAARVGASARTSNKAQTRVEGALDLATKVATLAATPSPERRLGPAWKLQASVVNHALSYDASVLEPGTVVPYAI